MHPDGCGMRRIIPPLAFLLAVGLAFLAYSIFPFKTGLPTSESFLRGSVAVLLIFLVFLILRYLFLLWYSFLDYGERIFSSDPDLYPFISIVVPAYNEGILISRTIEYLLRLDYPAYEVIVVDDGSTDDTYQQACVWEGRGAVPVRVITQPNSRKAAALNNGIENASGEIIFCMDADSLLEPQALRLAVRHFKDPNVGAVAGHVRVVNRKNLWTHLQSLEYMEGLNLVRRSQGFFRVVNIIPGPSGIFRKEVLEEVGRYASDTFAEDCDITLRILSKGWKIVYEPGAVAWTEAPENLINLFKQRYRWTRGILQSIRKNALPLIRSGWRYPGNLFVLAYMAFEGILWPIANILVHLMVIQISFFFGFSELIVYWWLQLLIFDIVVSLYCILMEKEDVNLLFSAFIYHTFFIFLIDTCKVMSMVDELFNARMRWGSIERQGY